MKRIILGKRLQQGILSLFIPAFVTTGGPVQANPGGGVVVHGAADIARMSANQLRIHQQTNNVVINWQNFSIGKGELTRFVQPNNGTALNRVTGGNISEIHGQLKGNANVYVINPNGIVVGSNGVIDVGGNAVLSTLDIDDDDFLNGGSNRFYGNSNTGVTNFGTISSANGDVVLMGGFVDNQGQIGALNGTVAIGAGGDILLEEGAGSKISVRGASDYTGTGINNTGTIRGASAELKAHGNVYALAINNGGAIRANGADRSSGRVLLRASGGSSNINLGAGSQIMATAGADGGQVQVDAGAGEAVVAGTIEAVGSRNGGSVAVTGAQVVQAASSVIDASGDRVGGSVALDSSGAIAVDGTVRANSSAGIGGDIAVTGETILINDSASLSADGHSAGGRIRVGGDFQGRDTGIREARSTRVEEGASLTADSLGGGHGGTAIVWANGDTLFLGEVSASSLDGGGNGGLVEVSGKEWLYFDGEARVGSVGGKAGTVLFDPGDVTIGAAGVPVPPLTSPVTDSTISISSINSTLQNGANVLVVTGSGNIAVNSVGGGGDELGGTEANNRDSAIQWTNSQSSFGAFASGSILVGNHIRTSGAGSINLLGGWGGSEGDAALQFDPQSAWDFYVGQGNFGNNGGSVFIGSSNMTRHVEVGSRFGDTNVAGFDVRVIGSDTAASNRYAMIGFHDGGQLFAPRLNRGTDGGAIQIRLDMKVGAPEGNGAWLLSDGRNVTTANFATNQAAAGVGNPIVAIAGQNEVDLNGDGIMDGVRGVNSTGVVAETFIPYASHFNSATTGNWWWQQIEDPGSAETRDPLNLGGLRPEYGAGVGANSTAALALGRPINGADINVLAKGSVVLQGGSGNEAVGAMIGHMGPNRSNNAGNGTSIRDVGNEDINNASFSVAGIEGNQMERRWSFNGADNDRMSIAGARLAPVYGNINVFAGTNGSSPISVNHSTGKVTATVGTAGDVVLRAAQVFDTGGPASNASVQIGHGGVGQFGEFFGDIFLDAGRSVTLLAGEATRASATIGHTTVGHAYWDPTSVVDQQLRFFATTTDFDNPNLRRGELFSGAITTGFNPTVDPERLRRYNLTNFPDNGFNATGFAINTTLGYSVNQYTRGTGGGNANQGLVSLAPLDLSPAGVITVEALNGSVLKGMHGRIDVFARTGDVTIKGYQTENISSRQPRDRRFAGIGHGGTAFAYATLGSGYRNILGTPTVPSGDGRENASYRMNTGNETATGTSSYIGDVGGNMNRHLTFMSITGDINVEAGGSITVMAGNDVADYARIGHGGSELADFETSSFILGDIRVVAGGNIDVIGGGSIQPYARGNTDPNNGENNYDLLAPAYIGHGGYRAGFMGYLGDISVSAGGSILVRNGAFSFSPGKIGHQTIEDRGQVGGNFTRLERFLNDSVDTRIESVLNNSVVSVTYSQANANPRSPVGVRDLFASGAGTLVEGARNTANISVVAGGGVTVDHLQIGRRQPAERLAWTGGNLGQAGFNADNQGLGIRTRNSFAQIGHGGINTIAFQVNNTATNYQNKIGNISVVANGGDVEVKNGEGQHRFSRIGHGVGRGEVQNDSSDANFSRAIELAGNITVRASGDIRIDAAAAAENERPENTSSALGKPYTSEFNPAAIGHGGVENNTDLVVLGRGELMNGIGASSNVTAVAGGSLYVLGGLGVDTSFAQLGHGFSSDQGNDFSRRRGVPTGFAGDITVSVDGNVSIVGGPNAWSEQPSGLTDGEGRTVHGAFAAIGHGGYQLDAPSFGKIQVYVGNDLNVIAQRRTDPETTLDGASPYSIRNPTPGLGGVASAFNFAKIGHFSVENRGPVGTAPQTGDITVVVGRDAVLQGGITPDVDTQTIYGAFAQIGHGGPSIIGDLKGDITVLVKRNLSVIQGSETNFATGGGNLTDQALNNYAMIGNGDFLRDTGSYTPTGIAAFDNALQLFRQTARGFRDGNIVIAAGNNASFNGAMIGHLDPAKANIATTGNTQIAVSRLFPFFGGRGTLTAVNGTVFSSGGFGNGSQMQFFMPARSNNAMDATTRINERTVTFSEAPDNFAAPFNTSNGILAGRNDEVYLTPDLWWDQAGQAAAGNIPGGGVFPTDAISGQGGSLAMVNSPGGLRNLDSLAAGSLGGSAPLYRDLNGVSGSGLYTLYYDAIEFVSNTLPTQPTDPNIPIPVETFDFAGLFFNETYDAFFREEDLFGDGIGGYGDELYYTLGLFERDSETWEGAEAMTFEDRLDNLFGERRDSNTQEEEDEEEENRRKRGRAGGPVGMTFYVFEPGTNRYSSYRVFGNQVTTFYPAN
ncbi:MAG: filamentous hemagglutinin N-terminal domain-containing protein [Verrucomicrobiales bacterium]|nr:filamentous hemagglutinin N-terminal domain-containing protein [Verrucomicrobiales bacterium]